ncbi:hypothetical protein MESS2_p130013 [Mesorhizobium metallidurans STM 2683]|uniref:Uncharacterized protein n=1 Tax=Mesorhizobium metallidurans STM 2683 TaxID=1297569 RepID=M5EZ45_9HYPH|nr:hypothetical protein MESS2_p130013 [Mesorhizobium metallidurans STM 2683]
MMLVTTGSGQTRLFSDVFTAQAKRYLGELINDTYRCIPGVLQCLRRRKLRCHGRAFYR